MKHVPLLVALVLVVAACNLTNRFKSGSSNSNSSSTSSSGNPSKVGDEPVEKAAPTAAQMAALANGQEAKWDQQGITWTFPPNWKKQEVRNETLSSPVKAGDARRHPSFGMAGLSHLRWTEPVDNNDSVHR